MKNNFLLLSQTVPALDYITVIGGSISIVCLIIAIFIFFWVDTLREEFRFHIHRNLCISMLLAQMVLLLGLDATQNVALCTATAIFLHLFFLCAFGWMFVEGLLLYCLITKVWSWTIFIFSLMIFQRYRCSMEVDLTSGSHTSLPLGFLLWLFPLRSLPLKL